MADFQYDPYPLFRRLRDEFPAYRNAALRFRALSRDESGCPRTTANDSIRSPRVST